MPKPVTTRRWFAPPRRADERGAVVLIVAVVLGFGVLLGMGALVVDVGQMYDERQQVQSGADAAAEAVAHACETNADSCAAPTALAKRYAGKNADDGVTDVWAICSSVDQTACPPKADNLTDCVEMRAPVGDERWVQVYTRTETSNARYVLPPTFARAIAGNAGYSGAEVGACSRAYYQPYTAPPPPEPTPTPTPTPSTPAGPTPSPTVAATPSPPPSNPAWSKGILVSLCEWQQLTANGTKIYDYDAPSKSSMVSVFRQHEQLAAGSGSANCPVPRTNNTPNGYDWLIPKSGDPCHNWVSIGSTVTARSVSGGEEGCVGGLTTSVNNKIPLTFTIYDSVTGTPGHFQYHIVGVSGFVITGFRFANAQKESIVGPSGLCSGTQKCIYGYFSDKYIKPPK
jgi:hypothetical protein